MYTDLENNDWIRKDERAACKLFRFQSFLWGKARTRSCPDREEGCKRCPENKGSTRRGRFENISLHPQPFLQKDKLFCFCLALITFS